MAVGVLPVVFFPMNIHTKFKRLSITFYFLGCPLPLFNGLISDGGFSSVFLFALSSLTNLLCSIAFRAGVIQAAPSVPKNNPKIGIALLYRIKTFVNCLLSFSILGFGISYGASVLSNAIHRKSAVVRKSTKSITKSAFSSKSASVSCDADFPSSSINFLCSSFNSGFGSLVVGLLITSGTTLGFRKLNFVGCSFGFSFISTTASSTLGSLGFWVVAPFPARLSTELSVLFPSSAIFYFSFGISGVSGFFGISGTMGVSAVSDVSGVSLPISS